MKNIFIGFILIFLDLNLNFGNSRIGFLPDFIGYMIMITGLVEMANESSFFMKVKPFATGMAVYTGIIYFMDLFGVTFSLGILSYVLAFTSTAISLYISYNIVMGVKDMEQKYRTLLNGDSLKQTWTLMAVFNVLSYALLVIPLLAIVSIIVAFLVAIGFLVAFNHSKNMYYGTVR